VEREITLSHGGTMLHLDLEHGGRASSVEIGDLSLLAHVDPDSPFHWGSFVMAPWAGRIRRGRFTVDGREYVLPINWDPHAIHGTVLDRPWRLVEATDASAVLECPLDDRWPWDGLVRQTVRLAEGKAEFGIEVRTEGEAFPAAAGWHPWFRRRLARGEPVEIALDAAAMLRRDVEGIATTEREPTPPQPWDDCFDQVRWPIRLTWPGALDLEISGDTRYAVVYTEPTDAVCVEPQTGPPDALNIEPASVTADRPLTATMRWVWRRP
jgi:aldose 1-epimerase